MALYLISSSNAFGGRPLFGMTFLSLLSVMVLDTITTYDRVYEKC